MRQDKDRGSKWLIAHHGDAILKLAGLTGFTSWRALTPETVAPRRLPDGLLEVQFPDHPEPSLVLIEIEAYADADVDRQVFEDVAIVFLERQRVPDVVSLVLKPKGRARVSGTMHQESPRRTTTLLGSWPVVCLWDLAADELLADADAGMVPWVPLTRTDLAPERLLERCVERISGVPDARERSGLLAVTQILAGFAYPKLRFWDLFGGIHSMIESPIYDEALAMLEEHLREKLEPQIREKLEPQIREKLEPQIREKLEPQIREKLEPQIREKLEPQIESKYQKELQKELQRERSNWLRSSIRRTLDKRFGVEAVPAVDEIEDVARLDDLLIVAATCASREEFAAALAK